VKIEYSNNRHVEFKDNNEYWYQNGILHRDNDLPAVTLRITLPNGSSYSTLTIEKYFKNGIEYSLETERLVG